jgi:hypothetical protein
MPAVKKEDVKQDRFLTIILGVIGVLIVVAIGLFFIRRNTQTYKPDDTPEGVVHNYLLALNQEDYEKAFGYLATNDTKPDFGEFERVMTQKRPRLLQTSVRILSAEIDGNRATVELSTTREETDLFEQPRSYNRQAKLIFQDGNWKLTEMPYYFWH